MEENHVAGAPAKNVVSQLFSRLGQIWQTTLDSWVPYSTGRWIATMIIGSFYALRVYMLQGFYIVTYALGIYYLNIFIAFLSPKIDPAFQEDPDDDGPELPTTSKAEFKPFIRRLPEFKFWYSGTKAILIAMTCTLFEAFNIPVFWPILVVYFITLFCITMKRQIKHMIHYRYLPFSFGKPKYVGKPDGSTVGSAAIVTDT